MYVLSTGCQWRYIPKDLPPRSTLLDYLIDFYHVCEYLSAAAKTIAPDAVAAKLWMEAQKDALKTGRAGAVLKALLLHFESLDVSDDQAPVRVCHRYLRV